MRLLPSLAFCFLAFSSSTTTFSNAFLVTNLASRGLGLLSTTTTTKKQGPGPPVTVAPPPQKGLYSVDYNHQRVPRLDEYGLPIEDEPGKPRVPLKVICVCFLCI